jgi:tripartite-type tricarboxylate transporter receptor subunit TctC
MNRRNLLQAGLAAALPWSPSVRAQMGAKPLKIVVPYAAGGQTDVLARALALSLERTLKRPVIVENKPGAGALIGTKYVQAAAPDGDTVLYHNSGIVAVAMLQKNRPYDPVKDFAPVAITGQGPNFLMVHESVPARTMPEFLAWARAQQGGIECANSGLNTGGHLSAMLFAKMAKVKLLHVPYKGSAEVTNALLSGQVKMQISVTTESLNPYIKEGKIRLLGVATKQRTSLAPDVPAISEFVPGYNMDGWFGILAPAGTPIDKRTQLAEALKQSLDEPQIKQRYREVFQETVYRNPKEFEESMLESVQFYTRLIQELNLAPT